MAKSISIKQMDLLRREVPRSVVPGRRMVTSAISALCLLALCATPAQAAGSGTATINVVFVPRPTVSVVTPNAGPVSGGQRISVAGTGFVRGAKVEIGQNKGAGSSAIDATAVVVVSSTQITAVTGGPAKVGTWNLFVITPGGTSTANAGDDYRYYPDPKPTVSAVTPDAGPVSGGQRISVTGTGFVRGAKVEIGQNKGAGSSAIDATAVVVVSSTQITAVTGGPAKVGTWNLFVITPGGTSTANAGDDYRYY